MASGRRRGLGGRTRRLVSVCSGREEGWRVLTIWAVSGDVDPPAKDTFDERHLDLHAADLVRTLVRVDLALQRLQHERLVAMLI